MKLSSEALALGRALVEQLDLDERRDLLARWLANDIALKMEAADKPDATNETKQACADAIYALWRHRNVLPNGRRPFEDLEKVAQLLADLDPSNGRSYYYRPTKAPGEKEDKWLEAAQSFDRVARALITYCLQRAAIGQGLQPAEWVELADAAGLEAPERLVVQIVLQGMKKETEQPAAELHRKADRLKELLGGVSLFRKASAVLAQEMRAELAALGPLPPRPKKQPATSRSIRTRAGNRQRAAKA